MIDDIRYLIVFAKIVEAGMTCSPLIHTERC